MTPEQQAALDAYHAATNQAEERIAYQRMRAASLPPSYGESDEPAADGNPWPFIEWMTTWPRRIGDEEFDRDGNRWLLDGGTLRCVEQKARPAFAINKLPAFVADLIAKNMDWPGTAEMGERLSRLVVPSDKPDLLSITRDVARAGGA